jgi:hypothetical protein
MNVILQNVDEAVKQGIANARRDALLIELSKMQDDLKRLQTETEGIVVDILAAAESEIEAAITEIA